MERNQQGSRAGSGRAGALLGCLGLGIALALGAGGCRGLSGLRGPGTVRAPGPERPPGALLELPLPGESCRSPLARRNRQRLGADRPPWAAGGSAACRA